MVVVVIGAGVVVVVRGSVAVDVAKVPSKTVGDASPLPVVVAASPEVHAAAIRASTKRAVVTLDPLIASNNVPGLLWVPDSAALRT